jgi:8-oxo-dGTP pyrophosphatase MutT (NUDIX family)
VQPIYKGKYLHFFRAPNGWEYVQRPKAQAGIAIIAVTCEGRLLLVEQYRTAVSKTVIELPAGLVEPEQDANSAVRAELRQETGYTCAKAVPICEGALSPGLVNETNIMYRVYGVRRADSSRSDKVERGIIRHGLTRGNRGEPERIQTWEVPVDDVPRWLEKRRKAGAIIDMRIYASLHFLRGREAAKRIRLSPPADRAAP